MKIFNDLRSWLLIQIIFLCWAPCFAQPSKILSASKAYLKSHPVEKLYVHTDKPYYVIGDTLWYKAYLVNADFMDAVTRSGLLYVELINDSNKVIERQLAPVQKGLSWGNFDLRDSKFKEGTYTLRAYTNWMRNFGSTYFFTKQIQLNQPVAEHWLVKIKNEQNQRSVISHVRISHTNGEPLILRDVGLKVLNDGKNIFKGRDNTKLDGTLDVNFALPNKPEALTLQVKDLGPGEQSQQLDLPIFLTKTQCADLQFMPESGNFVAGLPSRVAFKAIDHYGKSVEVAGSIYDSKQREVSHFTSTHLGMGSFTMLPVAGEVYSASLYGIIDNSKTFPLPKVKLNGIAFTVSGIESNDSLHVNLMAAGKELSEKMYYFTGQSRNLICYIATIKFRDGRASLSIPKSAFPSGVARFSLLSQHLSPLNERLVYIDHEDNLNISILPLHVKYHTYDSVTITIEVKDIMGKPVNGNFSLSVTDDSQVKADTSNNIVTNMLLTSDLKGEIEDPAYYFTGSGTASKDLDNLLLSQGWTGFDWENVLDQKPLVPLFPAEEEFVIKGQVTNVLNHPVENSMVSLFSKKPFLAMTSQTDKQGKFSFNGINPVDTALFFIQARARTGESMNVGINIDEFGLPAVIPAKHHLIPWYLYTDTVGIISAKTEIEKTSNLKSMLMKGKFLKEVAITAQKTIRGSHNLNGPGEADQVIGQDELEKAAKMTLGDLLRFKVKRFHPGIFPPYSYIESYLITDKEVRLVIDGVDVDLFYQPTIGSKNERLEYLNTFLNYYTAEDIKGIEVMYNTKYNAEYKSKLLSVEEQLKYNPIGLDLAFIEITTRSGNGPFVRVTPGTYLYKPLAFSLPKQFYKPRYDSNVARNVVDLRSTIHWEPNLLFNINGKSVITFFAAGLPGYYSLLVQGIDINGNLGIGRSKLKILRRE